MPYPSASRDASCGGTIQINYLYLYWQICHGCQTRYNAPLKASPYQLLETVHWQLVMSLFRLLFNWPMFLEISPGLGLILHRSYKEHWRLLVLDFTPNQQCQH